jgi:hypothetical protein
VGGIGLTVAFIARVDMEACALHDFDKVADEALRYTAMRFSSVSDDPLPGYQVMRSRTSRIVQHGRLQRKPLTAANTHEDIS